MLSKLIAFAATGCVMESPINLPFEFVNLGTAAEANGTPRINIYDRIGESFWEEGITAKSFTAQLSAIDDAVDLDLHISTDGGDTKDGTVMYNALIKRKGKTNVIIDGYAISMGSVLAMAGKNSGGKTTMAKNALMMIHKPLSGIMGNADDFRAQADLLDKVEAALIEPYIEATGKDKAEISAMLKATTWFTAEEALEHGFITDIGEEETEIAACLSGEFIAENKDKLGNIPTSFINQFVAEEKSDDEEDDEDEDEMPSNESTEEDDEDEDEMPSNESTEEDDEEEDEDEDPVVAERKRCNAITQMCAAQGFAHKAQYFIEKGHTIEDAQDFVLELKASVDETISNSGNKIDTVPNGSVQGDWSGAYAKYNTPGINRK